jgi:manganese/zinc/iron transport system ATP- binding protein
MLRFPYSHRHYVAPRQDYPALLVQDLSVNRPDEATLALAGVSLRVPVGARWALVGPNGAGKSTLLKAVAGLLPQRSGQILIYGHPVGACHHRVAYLPQRGEIDWRFPISLRRLVMTGRYVHMGWLHRPSAEDWAIVDQTLARLGLSELAERQIGQLSGGQQQRTLLARALAQEADLILLDEPMNAVDNETRAIIMGVLDNLREAGKTVVIATHDFNRLEETYDGVLCLRDGREAPLSEVLMTLRQTA